MAGGGKAERCHRLRRLANCPSNHSPSILQFFSTNDLNGAGSVSAQTKPHSVHAYASKVTPPLRVSAVNFKLPGLKICRCDVLLPHSVTEPLTIFRPLHRLHSFCDRTSPEFFATSVCELLMVSLVAAETTSRRLQPTRLDYTLFPTFDCARRRRIPIRIRIPAAVHDALRVSGFGLSIMVPARDKTAARRRCQLVS